MYLGYDRASAPVWWGRHPATVGINNLAMVLAIFLYAADGTRPHWWRRCAIRS